MKYFFNLLVMTPEKSLFFKKSIAKFKIKKKISVTPFGNVSEKTKRVK